MREYIEILKLKEMLEKENIPFEFLDRTNEIITLYQICYPSKEDMICSVIEGDFSYGGACDKLEIMGLLTEEESINDEVLGYLTAEEVLKRIKRHKEMTKLKNKIKEVETSRIIVPRKSIPTEDIIRLYEKSKTNKFRLPPC